MWMVLSGSASRIASKVDGNDRQTNNCGFKDDHGLALVFAGKNEAVGPGQSQKQVGIRADDERGDGQSELPDEALHPALERPVADHQQRVLWTKSMHLTTRKHEVRSVFLYREATHGDEPFRLVAGKNLDGPIRHTDV